MTAIPEPIKRIVRQAVGFGCCKCGLPIIQYHHIVKNSQNPEEIMLLCPNHHAEATAGAMLEKEQRGYRKNPFNIQKGFVEGQLKVNQPNPVINIGTNQFIGTGDFLIVDGENLLSMEIIENRLELSMRLYDPNDRLVAKIEHNEWISGDPLPWDLDSRFQWLRIRRKLRDIQLEVDARTEPIDIRADIWRKRQNFQLTPDLIRFNGVKKNVGFVNLCLVALRLEVDTAKQTIVIAPDPRYGSGSIVSDSNIEKRIKKGLQAWVELSCAHEYSTIVDRKKYIVSKCVKCGKIDKIWK